MSLSRRRRSPITARRLIGGGRESVSLLTSRADGKVSSTSSGPRHGRFHFRHWLPPALFAVGLSASAQASNQCATTGSAVAADLASHVDEAFLEKMRSIGVKTIFRYYDHPNETLPGKTLHRTEKDLIVKHGFSLGVVFQHWNDRFSSFTVERGRADAERSLLLAQENGQTKNSAIYFGVDGGWDLEY